MRCVECRRRLTDEEIRHYDDRCEACERVWCASVDAWRHGAADPALDARYSAPASPPRRRH